MWLTTDHRSGHPRGAGGEPPAAPCTLPRPHPPWLQASTVLHMLFLLLECFSLSCLLIETSPSSPLGSNTTHARRPPSALVAVTQAATRSDCAFAHSTTLPHFPGEETEARRPSHSHAIAKSPRELRQGPMTSSVSLTSRSSVSSFSCPPSPQEGCRAREWGGAVGVESSPMAGPTLCHRTLRARPRPAAGARSLRPYGCGSSGEQGITQRSPGV